MPQSQSLSFQIDAEGFKLVADTVVEQAGTLGMPHQRFLLVGGRSSGGDRVSHASTRNMSCCAVLGQGAGIAAALSMPREADLDAFDPIGSVDIVAIQNELDRQGVRYE